jgi:hypothetical protein
MALACFSLPDRKDSSVVDTDQHQQHRLRAKCISKTAFESGGYAMAGIGQIQAASLTVREFAND